MQPKVRSIFSVLAGLLLLASLTGPVFSALPGGEETAAARLPGWWAGSLEIQGVKLRMELEITCSPDGRLAGRMISIDQNNASTAAEKLVIDGMKITLPLSAWRGEFTGVLAADRDRIDGSLKQGGAGFPLVLTRKPAEKPPDAAAKLAGSWLGTLDAQGTKIRLVLEITAGEAGIQGRVASPDQGNTPYPAGEITLQENQVEISIPVTAARFSGTLSADGKQMEGLWKQGGGELPLTFARNADAKLPGRPQLPVKPYPYREEEVSYDNPASGCKLAGTLTIPRGTGPFPAVLLITGSGLQDRDESIMGHKPFLVLADYLTRRNVAVLRVDDRGTGGSTGDPQTATTRDFATDVQAGVAFLKNRAGIDPARIGLVGHSEGGVIAPMVAADDPSIAFLVLMAGTGLPGEEILYRQGELISRTAGEPEADVAATRRLQEAMFRQVKTVDNPELLKQKLQEEIKQFMDSLPPEKRQEAEKNMQGMDARLQMVMSPWLKFFLTYDPATALERVKCPVLALNGEKDLQVPADANLAAIEAALKKAGNTRATVLKLEGLNHLFQRCEKGLLKEYGAIEETLNPVFLQTVGDWIEQQIKR